MFLYITKNWINITKDWWKLIIYDMETKEEQTAPLSLIEWIVIFGNANFSTWAIKWCLVWKIPVFFLSKKWSYLWKLDSLEFTNVELLFNHIKAFMNPEICLQYSKVIVDCKVHNSKVMLQRWNRFLMDWMFSENIPLYKQLDDIRERIKKCPDINSLRGLEWTAARYYFQWFGNLLAPHFQFKWRNRRPPKDPANAMLSLWYTLLAQTIQMILEIHRVNVYIWFYHQPKDLRTLLVLDLMEMFRAWTVDDIVLRLVLNKKITPDMFIIDEDDESRPCNMDDEALRIFIWAYYNAMFKEQDSVDYENDFKKLKYIELEIEKFKKSLVWEEFDYEGFKIK